MKLIIERREYGKVFYIHCAVYTFNIFIMNAVEKEARCNLQFASFLVCNCIYQVS